MSQSSAQPSPKPFLVVDDHEMVLGGTATVLKQRYPDVEILTAQTAATALQLVASHHPELAVVDLAMPDTVGAAPRTDTGLQLLSQLMTQYPQLNIVVQSAHVRSLVRLRLAINAHEGGFTVADKSLSMQDMLTKVDWALQGLIFTPKEMRSGLELKPEWLEVLQLAFQQGLQDKAIAERMHVSERSVRHYWTKIQDALEVYPDEGLNIRIQTEIRARQEGLID
jgi:DNA-binding NarL/FixJ family response regulator